MSMLEGKKIIVGVTGGIAAYKSADLVSKLSQRGVEVHVLMTPEAAEFVSPLTFRTLSRNHVFVSLLEVDRSRNVPHIELAQSADLIVVVPATANTIAKLAHGLADDFISIVVLAAEAPVLVAPSMNANMFKHSATQRNLLLLKKLGYYILEPETGTLACGSKGTGRLPETNVILGMIEKIISLKEGELKGKTVLVTAGGTREPIDPIRYIGNRSSGKMGYALAEEARDRGACVILISGAAEIPPPDGVEFKRVESTAEMYDEVMKTFAAVDVVIKAAAVSDFRTAATSVQKIKKSSGKMILELETNPDILLELGRKKTHQILIGFAAETDDLESNATIKLKEKNVDMIVANDVTGKEAGFGSDTNIVTLFRSDGKIRRLPKLTKREVARYILDEVSRFLKIAKGDEVVDKKEE